MFAELVFQAHIAGMASRFDVDSFGKPRGYFFERPVLQESCKQQVARFEHGNVVRIGVFTGREKPHNLHVEERRRNHEELARRLEFLGAGKVLEVGDEVVRDRCQAHLGDVHFVLGNQRNEKVERPVEIGQIDAEAVLRVRRSFHCESAREPTRGRSPPRGDRGRKR